MARISRRDFASLAAVAAVAPFASIPIVAAGSVTAEAVIDRIRKSIGPDWKPESVDGLKAGNAATTLKGVVTTSMATLAVLQQGFKFGANLFITAQPTFYGRSDSPAAASSDPIVSAKNDFIAKNNLVVFRLSEQWRMRQPDPFAEGFATALEFTKYRSAADPLRFDVPPMTMAAVAAQVKNRFQSRGGIRAVGDPRMKVQRVGILPGTTPIQAAIRMLPEVDVIIAGEVREWESVEYARDHAFAGGNKGLILIGRVVSEEPGMELCAQWLKTIVPEVPVRHIRAGDPYWRPVS